MDNVTIQLIIIKQENLDYISEILDESVSVKNFLVRASISLTPNEVIQLVLGLPLKKSVRVPLLIRGRFPWLTARRYTRITSFHLKCPSLQGELLADVPIGKQGIVDDTVLVLVKYKTTEYDNFWDDPEAGVAHCVYTIAGISHFNEMIRIRLDETKERYSRHYNKLPDAILLYTDEDIELAKYVRLNFSALDRLSGPECDIYVIERPPQMSLSETIHYWKNILTFKTYVVWGGLGWTYTKPYDKAAAYDIARILDIPSDQLPCVVFLKDATELNKIIIPIQGEFPVFFRKLFATLKDQLEYRWENNQWDKFKEKLIKFINSMPSKHEQHSQCISISIDQLTQINTYGGTYVAGNVNTSGDFIGRDNS